MADIVKIGFISLGCAKNQVDLENLAGRLNGGAFEFTVDTSVCDLIIINTCGFIRQAVENAIEAILTAKAEIPSHAKIIVMGCMSERYRSEIAAELPEVDFFAGVNEHEAVLQYIENTFSAGAVGKDRFLFSPGYYAYLRISDGCDNRCSYCTIPFIRGPHRSVKPGLILKEAERLASAGVKELVIISQDSTKYGSDLSGDVNLAKLMRLLAEKLPDVYFRIMYLNPDGVTEELVDTVADMSNIIKYFDIPVQHISDTLLFRMNRHSDSKRIRDVFGLIRRRLPDAFIRTTVMSGFPGETEKDYEELYSFIQDCAPDYAGFFAYSPEEGTAAEKMDGVPDKKVTNRRLKALQSLQKKNTLNRLKRLKEEEIVCFVEKANEDFSFILEGRALFQAPEADGILYVTDGRADKGCGPYKARISKIVYPDVYVNLLESI